jgi:propionate CoA-transferase
VAWVDNALKIVSEGRHSKFVNSIEQICYNARFAAKEGREALFVTERCVFRAAADGLELTEVAPGIDVERDILAHMGFRPRVAQKLALMDARLFKPEVMGIKPEIARKAAQARQPRRRPG